MNWRQAALLPFILALGACASEGGSRGSGISSTVVGNVASVQTAAHPMPPSSGTRYALAEWRKLFQIQMVALAGDEIEGIQVIVEGTDIRGETDANGHFSVQGNFEGFIGLVFQLPDGGGQARIALNMPAAGTFTLDNVRVDAQTGVAYAETQDVAFEGIIAGIDCPGLTLTVVSIQHSTPDADRYTVRLDASSLRDATGNTVACADLRGSERVMVQGMANSDGSFGDATVELED